MKRFLTLFCLLFISSGSLFAQSTKSEPSKFVPDWYIKLQGGVGVTTGEANFGELLSPSAYLSIGRNFTPSWGLRIGVGGWQGKGAWLSPRDVYKFNFAQLNADVTLDLANAIGGYKHDRVVNPYVLLGLGGNFAFNNDEAQRVNAAGNTLTKLWTGSKVFVAARAGVGVDFRLCERLLLGLEVNTNMLPDKFNSKKGANLDWHTNALLGLTYRFGKCSKKVAPVSTAPIPQEVKKEPVHVAKQPEPIVEKPTPIVEKVVEKVVEKPTPVVEKPTPVVRKNAPAPPSPDTYKTRQDVFFTINSSDLHSSEGSKIDALVKSLKENPKSRVSVVGYADVSTGNSKGNYWLSGWRAIRVRDSLKSKGISASRIDLDFKGDKEQPYSDVPDNRVVICIVR